MTDESNGESGFEFVEKKSEEILSIAMTEISKSGTAVTSHATGGLVNIAPPSALPSFVTSSVATTNSLINQSQELLKNESIKSPLQLSEGITTTQPTASTFTDNISQGPQVLIAPDSPTMDTGAFAGSLFTWVKDTVANSNVLSKVAEKAKSSVNSMITTLDPQMREFIYSGGDIEIIIASDKDAKIAPVREAFQNIFGNATVNGTKVETSSEAAQPVGFAAGVKAAQERIAAVRKIPSIPTDIPIIAVENFLLEVGQGKWYDLGVIILEDIKQNINLQTFTQMTPVPSQIVEIAQESTPKNYSKDGLAVTIGSLMGANLQVPRTEWHSALTGVSRKDIIFLAAQSLAGIYKNTINPV
ncbi:protein PRRC1-like [Phymastichus coffea]|uniref:protein PRRC1-like n=1 Tax=Phymastichus coffea TaxID=108790 RepID=UPI00273B909E|nr:protein PRRC1-like [Phymastichus coffea]XP_058790998.1 protein PRRC1-like [Phymastichus coffea]XP_058790999.1 protein PRRC1-like [Phymastichus coffea]